MKSENKKATLRRNPESGNRSLRLATRPAKSTVLPLGHSGLYIPGTFPNMYPFSGTFILFPVHYLASLLLSMRSLELILVFCSSNAVREHAHRVRQCFRPSGVLSAQRPLPSCLLQTELAQLRNICLQLLQKRAAVKIAYITMDERKKEHVRTNKSKDKYLIRATTGAPIKVRCRGCKPRSHFLSTTKLRTSGRHEGGSALRGFVKR